MQVIKSFFIAVSLYSKIPVLQFEWKEEDMKYIFCFFPLIGAIIGICIYLWNCLCNMYNIGILCRTAIAAIIPIFITGGFHIDGFMDTMDALHSYSPIERKLEILKDSHIGAFAVIMLALYGIFFLGTLSEIKDNTLLKIMCCGFFLSRCLSGISAVSFPMAKKDGMLYFFVNCANKRVVKVTLYIQSIICIGGMLFLSFWAGFLVTVISLLIFIFYYYHSKKEFGGITGDTAGYFVVLCEVYIVVTVAFINIFLWR